MDTGHPLIAIGGTGVIGRALQRVAARRGQPLVSISLDPDAEAPGYRNLRIDLAATPPAELIRRIRAALPAGAPPEALLAIAGFGEAHLEALSGLAAATGAPVGLVSSCLVYAPLDGVPDETAPLLDRQTAPFPYQRRKLAEEAALRAHPAAQWRAFRTNHVLGRGALLGCIPPHNRDPGLLAALHSGEPLALARGGDVRLSFIHAEDLAEAMLTLMAMPETARQAMNLVHPQPVLATTYHSEVAALIGAPPPVFATMTPDPAGFWSLTARDSIYRSTRPAVTALAFRHDLRAALIDTLSVGEAAYSAQGGFLSQRLSG